MKLEYAWLQSGLSCGLHNCRVAPHLHSLVIYADIEGTAYNKCGHALSCSYLLSTLPLCGVLRLSTGLLRLSH